MFLPENLSFILNELGEERENYFNAMAPPIVQTSNFAFKTVDAMRAAFADEMGGYLYSRGRNPTTDILRRKLAALDGAEDALVFGSGAAAIFAGVLAQVKSGDHIVSVQAPYTWAQHMFDKILPRFGVSTTYVDGTDTAHFEAALRPQTRLIYLESPNSWTYALQDLKAVVHLARSRGIITMIDNSYCTPLYQQPIALGIDLSMQTATKYISGHSDTLGGVLSGSAAMIRRIFESEYLCVGSGISPMNAWLLLRGLRTLPLRLEKITQTTATVLSFLRSHPRIEKIIFPFEADFPQLELAKAQMKGACGLLTFSIRGSDVASITRFCESLRHFTMAVSWGGHESLVIPKCAGMEPAAFDPGDETHRYIRMYTGLEDARYLVEDLEQALQKL